MKENRNPQCPYCKTQTIVVKNGIILRKKKDVIDEEQRYLCRNCNKNFFNDTANPKVDKQRQAIMMYLEGMGFSEIGEFLDVDRSTVERWFNKFGIDITAIEPLRNSKQKENRKIEEVHAIAIDNYPKNFKHQLFNDGFIIVERKKRVHISFLKENQKYTMKLIDKNISKIGNKSKIEKYDMR